jgi:nucleotide-binding universal stress UspA family protein
MMKILIAIDFSEKSAELVEKTVSLLRNALDSVCLLHVAEPDPDFVGYGVDPPVMRDQVAQHFHIEHVQLQDMASALRERGINAKALLVQGETGKTIVQQAEKLMVDMIVVGSSKHGAIHHFWSGDTLQGVSHQSGRPVLVMPVHNEKP